jgi:phosphocarrier protein HPr
MLERRVKIVNPLGLHARAAAQLVRLAGTFKSKILLKRTDSAVIADAKSILNILTLAAPLGSELDLEVNGEDESIALEAVADLFARGFGEI